MPPRTPAVIAASRPSPCTGPPGRFYIQHWVLTFGSGRHPVGLLDRHRAAAATCTASMRACSISAASPCISTTARIAGRTACGPSRTCTSSAATMSPISSTGPGPSRNGLPSNTLSRVSSPAIRAPAFPAALVPGNHAGRADPGMHARLGGARQARARRQRGPSVESRRQDLRTLRTKTWPNLGTKGRIAQVPGCLEIRGSDERTPCQNPSSDALSGNSSSARSAVASRSAPKIGHRRSQNRAKRSRVSRHDHMSRR